jgi:hypothetical protein
MYENTLHFYGTDSKLLKEELTAIPKNLRPAAADLSDLILLRRSYAFILLSPCIVSFSARSG